MVSRKLDGVDADGVGEGYGLGEHAEQADDPVVYDELEAASGSGPAEPHGLAADGVENRLALLSCLLGAGGEHYQLALLRGLFGPEDGGVDEVHAVLVGRLREPPGAVLPHRAHLQPHAAFGQRAEHVARYGFLHDVRVGQHGQEEVGAARGIRRAVGHLGAVFSERLGLLARAVPGPHLQTLGEEVARHRDAHDPGSQDRHLRAFSHRTSRL